MKVEGEEILMGELEKAEEVMDVSFTSNKVKRYILLLLILLFVSPVANAVNYPQLSGYVTDNASMIDQSYKDKITQLAQDIEKEYTVEIAVVTIESLEGESMEMYAAKLFETWGIGKKDKDNGLLIIVAKDSHDYRFEVGYGLEGTITDSMKVNIGDRIIVPNFRNGDYGKGIYESMLVVQELLKGNQEVISQYSMLQTTPLNVQSSVSQQNESTNWIYLVGILAIITIGIVVLSMRRRERALRPTPNHVSPVPVLKLDIRAANTIYDLQVLRGYSVLSNNDIKFGVRLMNNTNFVITDADVILDYTKNLFSMKDSEIQHLGNIIPNGKRTATYLLKPLGCIHNEQINALITYKDHTGKKQTLHMRPKEVHCVCPFLKEKPLSEGDYSRLAESSEFVQEGISFKGISVEDLANFMGETCRHKLYKVREYEIEGKKVIYLSGESIGEKAYYLLTAVIQEYKGLTQVVLRSHSDKKYGLNGFMNEMADSLRNLVGSVQNAKEIGIIENTQVINIIDSVVQRTNFGVGVGNNPQVNIKDSVVQRSNIGSDFGVNKSVRTYLSNKEKRNDLSNTYLDEKDTPVRKIINAHNLDCAKTLHNAKRIRATPKSISYSNEIFTFDCIDDKGENIVLKANSERAVRYIHEYEKSLPKNWISIIKEKGFILISTTRDDKSGPINWFICDGYVAFFATDDYDLIGIKKILPILKPSTNWKLKIVSEEQGLFGGILELINGNDVITVDFGYNNSNSSVKIKINDKIADFKPYHGINQNEKITDYLNRAMNQLSSKSNNLI